MRKITPAQQIINEKTIEKEQAEKFLLSIDTYDLDTNDLLKTEDKYIRDTVLHSKDELKIIERHITKNTSSLMMVGFGYFPSTLIMIAHEFPSLQLFGVDSDREACNFTKGLLEKFQTTNSIQLIHSKAEAINFKNIDIIFLANALLDKKATLDAIYKTAKKETIIFTRAPTVNNKDKFEPLLFQDKYRVKERLAGNHYDFLVLESKPSLNSNPTK